MTRVQLLLASAFAGAALLSAPSLAYEAGPDGVKQRDGRDGAARPGGRGDGVAAGRGAAIENAANNAAPPPPPPPPPAAGGNRGGGGAGAGPRGGNRGGAGAGPRGGNRGGGAAPSGGGNRGGAGAGPRGGNRGGAGAGPRGGNRGGGAAPSGGGNRGGAGAGPRGGNRGGSAGGDLRGGPSEGGRGARGGNRGGGDGGRVRGGRGGGRDWDRNRGGHGGRNFDRRRDHDGYRDRNRGGHHRRRDNDVHFDFGILFAPDYGYDRGYYNDYSYGYRPYYDYAPDYFSGRGGYARLDYFDIRRELQRTGFSFVRLVREAPEYYVIDAVAPDGEELRLTVDAFSGNIVHGAPLNAGYAAAPPPPQQAPYVPPRAGGGYDAILRDLGSIGYRDLRVDEVSGGVVSVRGWDPRGLQVILEVDASTGQILRQSFL